MLIDVVIDNLSEGKGWPEALNSTPSIFGVEWCMPPWGCSPMAYRLATHEIVTREQYLAALALRGGPWDGLGLPNVGVECEYKDKNTNKWLPVIIRYSSNDVVVLAGTSEMYPGEFIEIARDVIVDNPQFRPIRSKSEKKRDEAATCIEEMFDSDNEDVGNDELSRFGYRLLQKIAAGKIPHIRID